jgi:hypothetical protein
LWARLQRCWISRRAFRPTHRERERFDSLAGKASTLLDIASVFRPTHRERERFDSLVGKASALLDIASGFRPTHQERERFATRSTRVT